MNNTNEIIEKLYQKLDAQDSIIDQQALEIASLQQRYNALLEAHKIQEELLEDKESKIDKAIEYIKNEDIDICTIRYNDIVDTKNELLEILGDKE